MAIDEEKLKSVKSEIRSLLVSCPVGLSLQQFLKDYNECIGLSLPFGYFHYKTALEFLNSIPDVVKIEKTSNGTLLVPVESKETSHINKFVSTQRKLNGARKRSSRKRLKKLVKFGNCRDYQTINKNNSISNVNNVYFDSSLDQQSTGSFDSDLDNLITWTNEFPKNELRYGETKRYRPLQRPSFTLEDKDISSSSSVGQTSFDSEDSPSESEKELSCHSQKKAEHCISQNRLSLGKDTSLYRNLESKVSNQISENTEPETNDLEEYTHIMRNSMNEYCPSEHDSIYFENMRGDCSKKEVIESHRIKEIKSLSIDNQKSKIKNDELSEEHQIFLWAFVNGIVLDEAKVTEPYKPLLKLTKKSNNSSKSKDLIKNNDIIDQSVKLSNLSITNINALIVKDNENSIKPELKNVKVKCNYTSNRNSIENLSITDDSPICLICKYENKDSCPKHNKSLSYESDNKINKCSGVGRATFLKQNLNSAVNENNIKTCISTSLSNFGRGVALHNFLNPYIEKKPEVNCGISRGYFLKTMQRKYSNN